MKNVELWSRQTDRKILIACGSLCLVVVAGLVLPDPVPVASSGLFGVVIATGLMVFVWGGFHVVCPARWSRHWTVAKFIAVPLGWLLLVVAAGLWFSHLRAESEGKSEELVFTHVLEPGSTSESALRTAIR